MKRDAEQRVTNRSLRSSEETVPRLLPGLVRSRNRMVEDTILGVLPSVTPAVATRLVDAILQRGKESGLTGLIETYHLLPPAEQQRLALMSVRFRGALRAALAEARPLVCLNAVTFIRNAGDLRLAHLLACAVCDADAAVSALAAEGLSDLASVVIRGIRSDAQAEPGEDFKQLYSAIRQSLHTFDRHRQSCVVEAAMRLTPILGQEFGTVFSPRRRRVLRATIEVFQTTSDPDLVGFAYRALASPTLREPIAQSISNRKRPAFMAGMIREVDRAGEPSVQRGLRLIKRLAWLRYGAAPLSTLPAELHAKSIRFLTALGLPVATRLALLREMIMTGPATLQEPALTALIEGKLDTDGRILRAVAGWGDSRISRVAQRGLESAEIILPGTISSRSTAAPEIDSSREPFSQLCRSGRPQDRLTALRAAREYRDNSGIAAEVLRLARDPNAVVQSAALNTLCDGARTVHRRLLTEALQQTDTRVQANAIEAMDRLGFDRELGALVDRLDDPDNRVRANVVRAFLRIEPDKGRAALRVMLESVDRSFRISGLWVAKETSRSRTKALGADVGEAVSRICDHDVEPQIRQRAREVRQALESANPARLVSAAPGGTE